MHDLSYGSCFETLLNQGLVMAKDTCEAAITKRLAWLVEPLVVSSHGFSLFFTLFKYTNKNHKNYFFYVFHFFIFHRTLLFSFFVFFF